MFKPEGERTVSSNGKARWSGVTGVSFQLVAARGNKRGYPVTVKLDDDAGRVVVLSSGDIEGGEKPFSVVEILDGEEGDSYTLSCGSTSGDYRRVQLPRDSAGVLKVTPPGGTVLFDLSTDQKSGAAQAFYDDWHGTDFTGGDTLLQADPQQNGRFILNTGYWAPCFDLTPFRRVLFGFEAWHPSNEKLFGISNFTPVVRAVSPHGGGSLYTLTMGSIGDFGANEWSPATTRGGSIELGVPAPEVFGSYSYTTPRLPPYAHFAIAGIGETLSLTHLLTPSAGFRFYVVGY